MKINNKMEINYKMKMNKKIKSDLYAIINNSLKDDAINLTQLLFLMTDYTPSSMCYIAFKGAWPNQLQLSSI